MMCECCESTVNNSLKIVGVETVEIKLKENKGYIEYNPSASCNPNVIIKSLEDAGFGVIVLEDKEVDKEENSATDEAQLLLTITINNNVTIKKDELINFLSLLEGVVDVGDVSKFHSEDNKNQWLLRVLFNENITGPRKMLSIAKEKGNITDITVVSFGGFMIAVSNNFIIF
jgi:copper chaperone CopZ